MANQDLRQARSAKKDEFYTQYPDIEREVECYLDYDPNTFRGKTILLPCDDPEWSHFTIFFAQNFERLGLKKLISTSYANGEDEQGKIYILDRDNTGDGRIDIHDLHWEYISDDDPDGWRGDFRSAFVTRLRDEADIIVTNPPFSLFREFFAWIMKAGKQFLIIGNMNAVTYKEVFPYIKQNQVWYGESIHSGDREFAIPDDYPIEAAGWRMDADGRKYIRVKGVRWYTNMEHGRRHKPMELMTMEDNRRYSRHARNDKWQLAYLPYDNYDAIEVPFSDSIPTDYEGVMGVPISFLDFYCPEQFEILGITQRNDDPYKVKRYTKQDYNNANDLNARSVILVEGTPKPMYPRILIRKRI